MVQTALCVGMYGRKVGGLHDKLRQHGLAPAPAEVERQFFGPSTREAVRACQKEHGLAVTGAVDEATRTALDTAVARAGAAPPGVTQMPARGAGLPDAAASTGEGTAPAYTAYTPPTTEYARELALHDARLKPDQKTTFTFGPPNAGPMRGSVDPKRAEEIPPPSIPRRRSTGGAGGSSIASRLVVTAPPLVGASGVGVASGRRGGVHPSEMQVEIFDAAGNVVASGPAPLGHTVTPSSGRFAVLGPARPWSVQITNRSLVEVDVHANVEYIGFRPILSKDLPLEFIQRKLDALFNDPQPIRVVFENRRVGDEAHPFFVLEMNPEWNRLYGPIEKDLGKEFIEFEEFESSRAEITVTSLDGRLALKLRVVFARGRIAFRLPWAPDVDIFVRDLDLQSFLVLTTERYPWLPPLATLPTFEVVAKTRIELDGPLDPVPEVAATGVFQWLLEQELLKDFAIQQRLHEAALTVLGWVLGDRGRDVVGSREHLTLLYAGDAPREPRVAPVEPPPEPLSPGNLSKIDHIVVLMMENRSFDHMLGYLSLPVARGGRGRADVDGLRGDEWNPTPFGEQAPVFALTDTRFHYDPAHSFTAVKRQRGGYTHYPPVRRPGRLVDGDIEPEGFEVGANQGFVIDYVRKLGSEHGTERRTGEGARGVDIMGYHPPQHVYMYDLLTEEYAICDRWFAAHPGSTWPNRFITLTGGLAPGPDGRAQLDNPELDRFDPLEAATIFDHLNDAQVSWVYYEHDFAMLRTFSRYTLDTERILRVDDPRRGFYAAAAQGALPAVTFIEPNLTDVPSGNDDHPPSDIAAGQLLVQNLYEALVRSPLWGKILLIITYDEHGGFFDHVHPQRGQAAPLFLDPDDKTAELPHGRPVDYYGMRVPTFVISPWIPPRTVSHAVFDHTSILKTILARFLAERPPRMGPRVAAANDLGPLLSLSVPRVGRIAPRVQPVLARRAPPRAGRSRDDFRTFMAGFRDRVQPRRRQPEGAAR